MRRITDSGVPAVLCCDRSTVLSELFVIELNDVTQSHLKIFLPAPRIHAAGARDLTVELPPLGNTLPLLPEPLHSRSVPAFVLEWLLETDEVVLMMQDLLPDLFPPVTPAVRPGSVREFLGPTISLLGIDEDAEPVSEHGFVNGLPTGVLIPQRVLEVVEMAEAY